MIQTELFIREKAIGLDLLSATLTIARRSWLACLLLSCAFSVPAFGAQHPALLPQPQRIAYGEGQLALQGLQLSLPRTRRQRTPSPPDGSPPVSLRAVEKPSPSLADKPPAPKSACAEPAQSMHCPSQARLPARTHASPTPSSSTPAAAKSRPDPQPASSMESKRSVSSSKRTTPSPQCVLKTGPHRHTAEPWWI